MSLPVDPLRPKRRILVPEVVQTSGMDCGPASLKCLLEGFGISASYGRLREACQTDVDGTSVDTLEDVAVQLGLRAEQIMLPVDHLLLPKAQTMPAIVVVSQPSGLTHFLVAWGRHGRFVQVMDPATGRRWLTRQRFLDQLYVHRHLVPVDAWREWAGSEGFCVPLGQRLANLRLDEPHAAQLIEDASEDPGWQSLASLDAATRITDAIVRAGGVERGAEAAKVIDHFFRQARLEGPGENTTVPLPYWSVHPPLTGPETGSEDDLILVGAVLVRVLGHHRAETRPVPMDGEEAPRTSPGEEAVGELEAPASLSPELVAALEEEPARPELEVLKALLEDGLLAPAVLAVALAMAALGTIIEILLLRGIIDIGSSLGLISQRMGMMGLILAFAVILLVLELPISSTVVRMGRRLETRLRIAFLEKDPTLER